MPALLLKFGPYAAIGILGLMLYVSQARNDVLKSEIRRRHAEYIAGREADNADAARVAIRETELAVQAERKRWQDLVAANNAAVAAAAQAGEAAAVKARDLQNELEALYRSDTDADMWADTRLPDSVAGRLRY